MGLAAFNRMRIRQSEQEQFENKTTEFDEMSVDELKAYAEGHSIDIGQSTSQKGILKKIIEATKTE